MNGVSVISNFPYNAEFAAKEYFENLPATFRLSNFRFDSMSNLLTKKQSSRSWFRTFKSKMNSCDFVLNHNLLMPCLMA